MKATSANQRTSEIMFHMRRLAAIKGLSAEAFRDMLNQEYLHEEDKVSIASVNNWLSGNPDKRPNTISSESIIAISEFIEDNQ